MIKRPFYILLSILLILLAFTAYLVTTESGLKVALSIATTITGGNFHVEKASGKLIHHVQLTNLDYKNKTTSIKIQNVDFSWRPFLLFSKKSYIHGTWKNMSLLFDKKNNISSKHGDLSINGSLNRYQIEFKSTFHGTSIPQSSLEIQGEGNLKQINLDNISLKTSNGNILNVKININRDKNNFKIYIPDLSFLQAFIPNISKTSGQLTADFNYSGTMKDPVFDGNLNIQNGKMTIDNIGLALSKINLKFSANKSDKILLDGSVYAGSSKLTLTGNTAIQQFTFPFVVNLKGNNALLYNNKSYQIYVSPDVSLTYKKPTMTLSGNLLIPKARITPTDFSNTVTLPNDMIVIRKKEDEKLATELGFETNINLTLGHDVYFFYGGLSANVAGSINLKAAPEQLTTASGNFNITKGTYKAYGTELKINKGNLIYTGGPINNPGLNFNVVKYIRNIIASPQSQSTSSSTQTYSSGFQNITVGMYITGTLDKPKLILFSDPSGMSQSDILSYLLFGFPSGQASGSQAQLLMKAAESTGIGGTLTSDIKQTFGLSELGFQSDAVIDPTSDETQQNTSFVLGKYLTPKLYISYSVGLLVPVNVFSARYFMSRHWMIQTDSSTFGNGADIFYTIQTN